MGMKRVEYLTGIGAAFCATGFVVSSILSYLPGSASELPAVICGLVVAVTVAIQK